MYLLGLRLDRPAAAIEKQFHIHRSPVPLEVAVPWDSDVYSHGLACESTGLNRLYFRHKCLPRGPDTALEKLARIRDS